MFFSKRALVARGMLFLGIVSGGLADAGDLRPPFEMESSQVLPSLRGNPRVKWLQLQADERWNLLGNTEPLGQKLNKKVSWTDLLGAQATAEDRALLEGLLQDPSNGISDLSTSGGPGSTTGVVGTQAQVIVPALAFGITSWWTMAVAVPFMQVDVSADTGFRRSEDGQRLIEAIHRSNPGKAAEVVAKLNDATNQKLKRLGMDSIDSHRIAAIGDAKWINKFKVHQSANHAVGLKAEVTAPTGQAPQADRALDVPTGDGQWDIGLGLAWDYQIASPVRLSFFSGYTAQLPAMMERRLPISETDSFSEVKERLLRNPGDQVMVGGGLGYSVESVGLNLGLGYTYQAMAKTDYRDGSQADGESIPKNTYRLLEAESPEQRLHALTWSLGFSTVEWYREKAFFYPFQAQLTFSLPLAGVSVAKSSVVMAELVLFF